MRRILITALAASLCAGCGGGVSSYEELVNAQADVLTDMIGVLEDVTDEASADDAVDDIEALGARLAELVADIEELPEPTAADLRRIAETQGQRMQEFQQTAAPQMMKLAQYPQLAEAWTRAVENFD